MVEPHMQRRLIPMGRDAGLTGFDVNPLSPQTGSIKHDYFPFMDLCNIGLV
jgi:hypothetical protein